MSVAHEMETLTLDLYTEAAQCAWEYIYNLRDDFDELGGAVQIRRNCRQIASFIYFGYCLADRDGEMCYDWEFIPWFIDNCVEVGIEFKIKPDWMDRCWSLKEKKLNKKKFVFHYDATGTIHVEATSFGEAQDHVREIIDSLELVDHQRSQTVDFDIEYWGTEET